MSADMPTLKPHQLRVVEERRDLDARIYRLRTFVGGNTFAILDQAEQGRMTRQLQLMVELSAVLGERIAAFHTD